MHSNANAEPTPAFSIDELAQTTPFLDLHWLFHVDPARFSPPVRRRRTKQLNKLTFSAFKKAQRKSETSFVKSLREAMGPDRGFRDVHLFCEYLAVTPTPAVTAARVRIHFTRLAGLAAAPDVLPAEWADPIDLITTPVLALRRSKLLGKADCLKVAIAVEAAIKTIQQRVSASRFSNDWLELLNRFTYAYMVLSAVWEVGVHPAVFNRHLLVFRHCDANAWSNLPDRTRMQFSGLAFHLLRNSYDFDQPFEKKLNFSHNTLADVRTLFQVESQGRVSNAFTTHQWVYRWLADKLDSDVFSIRGRQNIPADQLRVLSETEQVLIVDLARRFASYRVPVTADTVAHFVLQFGTTQRIRGALRLLSHIKFMPLWELSAAMESVLKAELAKQPGKSLVVAPLGDQTGSTAIIRYLAAHSSLTNIEFKDDIVSALKATQSGDRLYFIDDCLLSGTQALSILGDWMGTRAHRSHHTIYSPPLSEPARDALQDRELVFAYCVATDVGHKRFCEDFAGTGLAPDQKSICVGVVEPLSAKAFEPLGPVGWASQEECQAVRAFASDVGYDLLLDRAIEKGWTDQRRSESALGFSDFQRLLVFPYNVPKSTLTLLWAKGNQVRPWYPLFPGYD